MRLKLWPALALALCLGLPAWPPALPVPPALASSAEGAAADDGPAPAEPVYPSLFPPAPAVGPAANARRIRVDLSSQQLTAFQGATPVRAFLVSTGDAAHPTIVGRYAIQQKYPAIDLIGPDYYYTAVPYVMLFARPFYIHAAPWRAEFGVPASRGCVTLAQADAAWLFDWAEIGTPLEIWW